MWVIFFHDSPHFWLLGGEAYRVGKKDCHVNIQDDRSISRTHLTITVGLGSSPQVSAADASGQREDGAIQPIALVDSSTYGTTITAAAGENEDADDASTQDSKEARGTASRATGADTGILGLCYASAATVAAAAARRRDGSTSAPSGGGNSSSTATDCKPTLQLTKGVPFDVPVQRAAWHSFTIQLGHHGAALRLVWVDVPVLCEDVDVEVQTKLAHALRCCGIRQVFAPTPATAAPAVPSSSSASGQEHPPAQANLSRNTFSQDGGIGQLESREADVPSLPTVLGGSGALSLSQRTSLSRPPSLSGGAAAHPCNTATDQVAPATAASLAATAACYNKVSFLVTSTVQPSTAVVAMLCRAVPIVSPAFFAAIRDRPSPQIPLPEPRHFVPSLAPWWCDLLTHAQLTEPITGADGASGDGTAATASPSTASSLSFSQYFTARPERRELFAGVTFVLVQRALYEEVTTYLDGTGARVLWDGNLGSGVAPTGGDVSPSTPAQSFEALQSFFIRHQRHVVLVNETEVMPFPNCLAVLQHGLGLCCVEYGTLIESILAVHPLTLPAYPENARLPQTSEEVRARVALAIGEDPEGVHSGPPNASQSSHIDEATQDDGEATQGRRTNAQPLFPEVGADVTVGRGEAGHDEGSRHPTHSSAFKRPRREDEDGWVTFAKPADTVAAQTAHGSTGAAASVPLPARTVDIQCSPYTLPPYPCFEGMGTTLRPLEKRKGFVKQTLPPAEPLVEMEEHRARRQLAASMLTARVPLVDADNVVPEQIVMGGNTTTRAADMASAAFNAFDTVAHHASSRRRGTAARRGRGGGGAASSGGASSAGPASSAAPPPPAPAAHPFTSVPVTEVEDAVGGADGGGMGGGVAAQPHDPAGSNTFHIFDIDGIF